MNNNNIEYDQLPLVLPENLVAAIDRKRRIDAAARKCFIDSREALRRANERSERNGGDQCSS